MMDKQHIANTIIVVVLLAFAFSYRFEGAFTLSNWLATFFVTFVLVAFSVSMHNFAQGKIANHYLADIHTQVFAAGSLTTLITMFLSSGTIIYASPWTLKLKSLFSTTLGKRLAPGPSEFAKIALAGTLTSLFIAIGAQLLTPFLGQIAEILVKINVAIAISSLIPFLTLFPHTILNSAINQNTLVVLPTWLGKTHIAIALSAARLKENSKILVLAPTKPLILQHMQTFSEFFEPADKLALLTGEVSP